MTFFFFNFTSSLPLSHSPLCLLLLFLFLLFLFLLPHCSKHINKVVSHKNVYKFACVIQKQDNYSKKYSWLYGMLKWLSKLITAFRSKLAGTMNLLRKDYCRWDMLIIWWEIRNCREIRVTQGKYHMSWQHNCFSFIMLISFSGLWWADSKLALKNPPAIHVLV